MMVSLNRSVLRLMKVVSPRPISRITGSTKFNPAFTASYSVRHYSFFDGRVPATRDKEELSILKENIPPQEILTQSLKSATKADQVLSSIEGQTEALSPNIALGALKTLFQLHKSNNSMMSTEEIVNHKNFEVICKSVRTGLRLWSPHNLIEVLKITSYFGVPVTSIMAQSVLHLIKKEVNDLNIHEIVFLHMLCQKSKPDANIKALEIALPLVFEANVAIKLDRENIYSVADALDFSSKYRVSDMIFDELVTAASRLEIKDHRDAFKIARAVNKIPLPHPLKGKLSCDALDVLMMNYSTWLEKDSHMLLDTITKSCKRDQSFYHKEFFDAYVEDVVEKKQGVYRAILTANRLLRARYFSRKLLDYTCEQIVENPEELRSHVWLLAPFRLVTILAASDYLPSKWKEAEKELLQCLSNIPEGKIEYPWMKLASDLLKLGSFNKKLIAHIFDENYISEVLQGDASPFSYLLLLSLYQSVKALHPEYTGPFPSEEVIEKAISINVDFDRELPLKDCLEQGFGGSQYVISKVCLKLGFFSDHAVIIRKGGFPVSIQPKEEVGKAFRIEGLELPQDSQLLLISLLTSKVASSLPESERFRFILLAKCLDALGYKHVFINDSEWKKLGAHERVPFLMNKVKESAKDLYEELNL